jgi:hypothetical protein
MSERVCYTVDLTPEAWVALERHGYNPALPPRGVSGPPGQLGGFTMGFVGGERVPFPDAEPGV